MSAPKTQINLLRLSGYTLTKRPLGNFDTNSSPCFIGSWIAFDIEGAMKVPRFLEMHPLVIKSERCKAHCAKVSSLSDIGR